MNILFFLLFSCCSLKSRIFQPGKDKIIQSYRYVKNFCSLFFIKWPFIIYIIYNILVFIIYCKFSKNFLNGFYAGILERLMEFCSVPSTIPPYHLAEHFIVRELFKSFKIKKNNPVSCSLKEILLGFWNYDKEKNADTIRDAKRVPDYGVFKNNNNVYVSFENLTVYRAAHPQTMIVEQITIQEVLNLNDRAMQNNRDSVNKHLLQKALSLFKIFTAIASIYASFKVYCYYQTRKIKNFLQKDSFSLTRLIRQERNIKRIFKHIRTLGQSERPITLLFAGSTGVGKTMLAKELQRQILQGNKDDMLTISGCNLASEADSKLLIGSKAQPGLLEDISDIPKIILVDEFEKMHETLQKKFLQICDEGTFVDWRGHTIDLKNVVFVFTTNVGAEVMERTELTDKQRALELRQVFKKRFGPEFYGRMNEVCYFDKLDITTFTPTELDIIFTDLRAEILRKYGAQIHIDQSVISFQRENLEFGIRMIKNSVTSLIRSYFFGKSTKELRGRKYFVKANVDEESLYLEEIEKAEIHSDSPAHSYAIEEPSAQTVLVTA